jgi:polyisoprenoid-binding protein YceI
VSTTIQQTALPTGTWGADPVHSDIGFTVAYMAGTFRGGFSTFDVEVVDGVLSGTADVASVQVKDENLEAHLQTPDFFDAERHPQLGFRSHSVRSEGEDVTIEGELTVRGETRPITLTGTLAEPITDPYGNERFGLRVSGAIDRTQFGVSWNNPLPSGEPALSNEVRLEADLQLVKAA